MRVRKRPVVVEAVRLQPDAWHEVDAFVGGFGRLVEGRPQGCFIDSHGIARQEASHDARRGVWIPTKEGVMLAAEGDWIIRGVAGELYPCKADIFNQTYDIVEETV